MDLRLHTQLASQFMVVPWEDFHTQYSPEQMHIDLTYSFWNKWDLTMVWQSNNKTKIHFDVMAIASCDGVVYSIEAIAALDLHFTLYFYFKHREGM